MTSLLDDFRLAPILDDASLFGNTWEDLFSLDLPPLQDTSPSKLYAGDTFDTADVVSPKRVQYHDSKDVTTTADKKLALPVSRSTATLAEVLNEVDSKPLPTVTKEKHRGGSPRKRRRLDREGEWTGKLHLPQPLLSKPYGPQRHAIPPLLQGLHEPPPTAGLFPPIMDKPSPTWPLQPGTLQMIAKTEDQLVVLRPKDADRPELESLARLHLKPEQDSVVSERDEEPGSVAPSTSNVEDLAPTIVKPQTSRRSQAALSRTKWTDSESRDLQKGVQKYGVGNWKKILADSDLHFHRRTAVDLKDHHRVCLLRERKAKASKVSPAADSATSACCDRPAQDTGSKPKEAEAGAARPSPDGSRSPHHLEAPAGKHEEPEDSETYERRPRTVFTEEEDIALLKGFERYGSAWAKIRKDKGLGLSRRMPRDLRDRVRNKWPDKYEEPGLRGRKPRTRITSSEETTRGDPSTQEALKATQMTGDVTRSTEGIQKSASTSASLPALLDHTPYYVDPLTICKSVGGMA